jgi:chemotaxis protein MotB
MREAAGVAMNSNYFDADASDTEKNAAAPQSEAGAPAWFVTYADLMSLLLAFFIMIAAMSELKSEPRVSRAVESLQKQFGPYDQSTGAGADNRRFGSRRDDGLGAPPTVSNVRVDRNAPIGERVYFDEDSAALDDAQRNKLRQIQQQFQGKLQRIEIRGHTTRRPLPPGSPYRDHWELAFARCRAAADELAASGIDPRRIRLGVAAGNEPASPGDDPLVRRENSRVELFLLNEFSDRSEDSGRAAPPATADR